MPGGLSVRDAMRASGRGESAGTVGVATPSTFGAGQLRGLPGEFLETGDDACELGDGDAERGDPGGEREAACAAALRFSNARGWPILEDIVAGLDLVASAVYPAPVRGLPGWLLEVPAWFRREFDLRGSSDACWLGLFSGRTGSICSRALACGHDPSTASCRSTKREL